MYAVLSGINTLIVRVRNRDELFKEACRIAVEQGGFLMSLICTANRGAIKIVPVASAGKDAELLTAIEKLVVIERGCAQYDGRAGDDGKKGHRVQRFAKRPTDVIG